MKSSCTPDFWKLFAHLPTHMRKQARTNYQHFKRDPYHPSLHFKCIDEQDPIYSVRVGRGYRAVGWHEDDWISWYWIGTHSDYDHLFK